MNPYIPMQNPCDLYIITTAQKRDIGDWEEEMSNFLLSTDKENNTYSNKVTVDSWNNIKKYVGVRDSFFIFDEQRVVGYGVWTKIFLKITKANRWILLSATPGDTWTDYIPVFIANGFYKNKTQFNEQHIIWKYGSKWPQVDRYINTGRLIRLRDRILIPMDFERTTVPHDSYIHCDYDIFRYKETLRKRWDPYKQEPIKDAGGLCIVLRHIVNEDESRIEEVQKIVREKHRAIIFYNYDFELDILRNAEYEQDTEIAEWNGHKHQEIPRSNHWVYLVNYIAGSEGWNCIKTDTIVFYSQTYSYRTLIQAKGRIDRMNTPYTDLYYYHLRSSASIDISISRALKEKKKFNETKFVNGGYK